MKPNVVFFLFYWKKKIQIGRLKKAHFSAPRILNIFWLVRLIDAKGISVAQPIWYGREAVCRKLQNSLKTQKMHFLPVFKLT